MVTINEILLVSYSHIKTFLNEKIELDFSTAFTDWDLPNNTHGALFFLLFRIIGIKYFNIFNVSGPMGILLGYTISEKVIKINLIYHRNI